MKNKNPVCLITGGASGIGEACARLFAQRGFSVVIGDVQIEKGEAVISEIGDRHSFVRLDVRDEENFASVIAEIEDRFGRFDCLVNNAAIVGALGPISEIPAAEFDLACAIILRSVFFGLKHGARAMKEPRSGTIVNIASIAGLVGGAAPHLYSALKAAVIHLTHSTALELAEFGIRVNAVCPGNIETPLVTGVKDERWKSRMEKIRPTMQNEQPMNRLGLPEEIAEAVHWLASGAASFVTGHALVVDGGLTAGRNWRDQPEFMRSYHAARV